MGCIWGFWKLLSPQVNQSLWFNFKAGAGCIQSQVLQLCKAVASMYLPKSQFNWPQKQFDE